MCFVSFGRDPSQSDLCLGHLPVEHIQSTNVALIHTLAYGPSKVQYVFIYTFGFLTANPRKHQQIPIHASWIKRTETFDQRKKIKS